MEVNLVLVEAATERLFNPVGPPGVSAEANRYLCEVQKSKAAWTLCWELLDINKDMKCHVVGGAMIHSKITQDFGELHPAQYEALRARLVQIIITHATNKNKNQVLIKLIMALSAFVARTIKTFWTTAIPDMTDNLKATQPVLLLEFLAFLPDQMFKCGEKVRNLTPFVGGVLGVCHDALLTADCGGLHESTLRCVSQWIVLSGVDDMPANLLIAIIGKISIHHQAACDALLSALNHPDGHRYPTFMTDFMANIVNSIEPVVTAKQATGDMDALFSIFSLMSGMSENHSRLILDNLQDYNKRVPMEKLLNMLLDCTGAPGQYPADETLSRIPLSFWNVMLDDLSHCDDTQLATLTLQLLPTYEKLVGVLLNKCQLPNPGVLDADEAEDHRCYRQDIADCYLYAYNILQNSMFFFLVERLEASLAEYQPSTNNWKAIEACLFSLNSIGDMAENDTPCVMQVLSLLPRVPYCNDEVLSAVMTSVGIFAEKTEGDHVGPLVHLLLRGLQHPGTSAAASMALKDVAKCHGEQLAPVASDILHAVSVVLHPNTPIPLKHRDRLRLVAIVGHIVSALSSTEDALRSLSAMMAPFVGQLSEASTIQPTPALRLCVSDNLELLQSMFSSLSFSGDGVAPTSPFKPGEQLVEQLMPLFQQVASRYPNDNLVVMSLSDCVRKAVPLLEADPSCRLLVAMLNLILPLYQSSGTPATITCATSILTHVKPDQTHLLRNQFKCLCDISIKCFDSDLHESTDLLEAFYRMQTALLKKRLSYFDASVFSLQDLVQLCKYATLATVLPEQFTFRAAVSFLNQMVIACEKSDLVKRVIELCGEGIVTQIVQNMHHGVSRALVEQQSDILLSLNKVCFPLLAQWLNSVVHNPNVPHPSISNESKSNFARAILKQRTNKRILSKVVVDFTLEWRNLAGGEYAISTSNSNLLLR